MLLKGKEVAESINQRSIDLIKKTGKTPVLALFRVGNKESDLSYERGTIKRCAEIGVEVKQYIFPDDVTPSEFYDKLQEANDDDNISGILVFRPLPSCFDDDELRNAIAPNKDVDGCSDASLAGIFTNKGLGYAPCTAQAVMEILDYYHIDIAGKNVVVVGRSLVIGKPVSMMLLNKNATVTICHSKTKDIKGLTKKADIVVCAIGKLHCFDESYFTENQTVIDVGINFNPATGKISGDVDFEKVESIVSNITPVPGGVGSVTTSVLVNHVAQACVKGLNI